MDAGMKNGCNTPTLPIDVSLFFFWKERLMTLHVKEKKLWVTHNAEQSYFSMLVTHFHQSTCYFS